LISSGYRVRVFSRNPEKTRHVQELGAEVALGDIRSLAEVRSALRGIQHVVHAAAGISGPAGEVINTSVEGTRNVITAAREAALQRVLYISSFSVYAFSQIPTGDVLSEQSPLAQPDTLGPYAKGKRLAESLALQQLANRFPSWTILRLASVVGPGCDLLSHVGRHFGPLILAPGGRYRRLFLIHVDDAASAVVHALGCSATEGRVFNVSESCPLSARNYVSRFLPADQSRIFFVPYWIARSLRVLSAWAFGRRMSAELLRSFYCDVSVSHSDLARLTGWSPSLLKLKS
jgi:nucleoside-diphosphate-sugar epimerase